jgi:hypothetical protein
MFIQILENTKSLSCFESFKYIIGEHLMPAEYMYDKGDKGHPVAMPNISSAKTTLKIVGK